MSIKLFLFVEYLKESGKWLGKKVFTKKKFFFVIPRDPPILSSEVISRVLSAKKIGSQAEVFGEISN